MVIWHGKRIGSAGSGRKLPGAAARAAILAAAVISLAACGLEAGKETAAGSGAPGNRRIRVICDNNYPPYAATAPDGGLEGIVVDQWKAWERETGIAVELRGLPWAEAQAAFDSGEAEVIDTIFNTEERRRRYAFTEPYARIEVPVFAHKSLSGIVGPEDLRGLKVAVKDGDAAILELIRAGVAELTLLPSYEAIIEAAARLDFRVFCVDGPPALYFLYKRGIDRDYRIAFILNQGAFSRAVRKENDALLALVKRGFEAVPASTYAAIDRKWRGSEIGPRFDLRLLAWIGGGAAAIVALLLGIAWSLRARVARATAELREKVLLLEESQAKNRAFIAALPDYFFTYDREGRYLDFSAARPDLLALPPERFLGRKMSELGLPEALVARFMDSLAEAFAERRMTSLEYQLETPAGAKFFEGRIVPLGEDRALLVARDITESRRRDEQISASLREKEILLKEIHHRVKNNMQVISSLIQLQSYTLESERDRELLAETQSRIRAMAQLHELLYRSPDLASIDAAEYLRAVVEELALGHDAPGLRFSAEPIRLGLDEAVPLGLIANELLLNAIKYAYPEGRRGPIEARLSRKDGDLVLRVSDEGQGLKPGADPATSASMGFTIVRSLAAQLRASLVFGGPPGFSAELRFPVAPPTEQA